MRTFTSLSCFLIFALQTTFGQQTTTVTANSIDISDNLDLRAVATLFGESNDLEDFERRLNDPEIKISNLDLNQDNQVDYLRVVEILENNQHLIVIQAVLGQDMFQDIATLEVEKEARSQRVQVQVVGNEYFYGTNYVYEPVFITRPIIFNYFWRPNYVAYYSPWYWGYYPTYYYGWNPYPIYTYRNHVGLYVNVNNYCHYRPNYNSYYYHRSNHYRNNRYNAYERQHPNRSFSNRNQGYTNRNELSTGRNTTTGRSTTTGRTQMSNRNEAVRNNTSVNNDRSNRSTNAVNTNGTRTQTTSAPRATTTRAQSVPATSSVRPNSNQPAVSQNRSQTRAQAAPARTESTRTTARPNVSESRGSATPTTRSNSEGGRRG